MRIIGLRASVMVGLLLVTVVQTIANSAIATTIGQGAWSIDYNAGDDVSPYFDAMWVRTSINGHEVDWIYKAKFLEVGERPANTQSIQWTRFDLGTAAVANKLLAITGNPEVIYAGTGGNCALQVKATYEGSYTTLASQQRTITFVETFLFYVGNVGGLEGCDPAQHYAAQFTASSSGGSDAFFYRIVTVQVPDLGAKWCTNTYFDGYNGANVGTFVLINEGSIASITGYGELAVGFPQPPAAFDYDVKIEASAYGNTRRNNLVPPTIYANNNADFQRGDVVAVFNINIDTKWLFDQRPEDVMHDDVANPNAGDTSCVNSVLMWEYQTEAFYNTPVNAVSYRMNHWIDNP